MLAVVCCAVLCCAALHCACCAALCLLCCWPRKNAVCKTPHPPATGISALVSAGPTPLFISLVGDDGMGAFLRASLAQRRLDASSLIVVPGMATPCIAVVFDRAGEQRHQAVPKSSSSGPKRTDACIAAIAFSTETFLLASTAQRIQSTGEVAASVADVSALEQHFTPERLAPFRDRIQSAPLVRGWLAGWLNWLEGGNKRVAPGCACSPWFDTPFATMRLYSMCFVHHAPSKAFSSYPLT